jgi:hypothetical protein
MPYSDLSLQELALMYGTDKGVCGHNYIPFYESHLPKNPKKILEIGVKEGRSISMWKSYFPEAEIHGLDLFIEFDPPNINGVTWHKGNQCDWELLEQLRKEDFDVIIDDGSHNSRDQMITFFGLFNGKHYFIEDTHCAQEEFYRQGLPYALTCERMFYQINDPGINSLDSFHGKNIILLKCL